jgi:ketosteroid isomerase-like protein
VAESNLEIVKRGYEALAEGGFEDWLPFFDPEFEMTTPAALASEPGTYRGRDGIRRWFAEFYEAMDEVRLEPHEFHEVGELVVVPFTIHARGRATGLETEQRAVQVWHMRDGRAIRLELFGELDEALAAARDRSTPGDAR